VDETQQQPRRSHKWSFDGGRFLLLASVTLFTILLPLRPFLIHSSNDSSNTTLYWPLGEGSYFSLEQVKYMIQRLFPFERGLCHTYWAGNIWSLYLFTNKVLTWIQSPSVTRRLYQPTWISLQSWFPWIHSSFHLPVISPSTCAFCLILSLVPGLICAWNVATVSLSLERYSVDESTNDQHGKRHGISNINVFLEGVLYSSYCGFMFSYHVHEKAIMTCILPMTLLAFTSNNACVRHRFFRMCVYGHFGLLPLLFESMETTLKLVLYFVYLVWLVHELNIHRTLGNVFAVMSTSVTLVYTDVIHPIVCKGSNSYSRWEFLPLLLTSLVCAMGLTYGWIESFGALRQELAGISNQKRKVIM
jgi:alpha-1,3-glucosyltransferase